MTTAAHLAATVSTARSKRPFRLFFPLMALLAVGLTGSAFVPEYIEHAAGRFPIASVLHVHGAIMTAWITVFLVQAILGATGRITLHQKIGNFGFAFGWLAWASMIFVEWRALVVNPLPDDLRGYDWLLPGPFVYLTFPIFLAWGYRNRQRPDWHKRLLIFALFLSIEAAIQRYTWIPAGLGFWPIAGMLDGCVLVPLAAYDFKQKRKLHPATLRGALLLLTSQAILFSLWGTGMWREFAIGAAQAVRHWKAVSIL